MKMKLLMIALLSFAAAQAAAAQTAPSSAGDTDSLLRQLEGVLEAGDGSGYLSLLAPDADRSHAREFVNDHVQPGVTRAVARERFRTPLADVPEGEGYELMVEVFTEMGSRGHVATWQLHVKRTGTESTASGTTGERRWYIADKEIIDTVQDLYRLSLNPAKQYDAKNLIVLSEDLRLTLVEGSVFVAETERGITVLVLMGKGDMTFSPAPAAERGQVKIFFRRRDTGNAFYRGLHSPQSGRAGLTSTHDWAHGTSRRSK